MFACGHEASVTGKQIALKGRDTLFPDLSSLTCQSFDMILVDGPQGTRRWSRLGALALVPHLAKGDHLMILDDTHRYGELQTALALQTALRDHSPNLGVGQVTTHKRQHIFGTGRFAEACYF